MQKIGILLSRSTFYDTIGFDLFEGVRSGFKHLNKEDIKIITENISFGADKQQCYKSAEKLLLDENVDIVLAYIGHRIAELLKPLFLAANKMLIVLDAGANMPNEWPTCPNIFYHSLHNTLGAWLTARKAVADGYKSGGMITGYYDGGYLHTYSISKSFEEAGGTIGFNHATGYKMDDFTMEPLKNHLSQYPKSALLSLFSGDYVQWYFEEIKKWFENKNLPIYLSPFGMEETMLENAVFPSNNISGVITWSKKIDSPENSIFIETIEASGRKPNLFSLLGWESTQIVIKVLDLISEHKNKVALIASDLRDFEFTGPRGNIFFDAKTNTSICPLYNASIIENNGMCELKLESKITDVKEEFDKLLQIDMNNVFSAWYNSYTCI
jgi:branched-chain amino acid transport system substrate-binding protein